MLEPSQPPAHLHESSSELGTNEGAPPVETIFAGLADAKAVVLAVSGGPDSVALMLMGALWAENAEVPPLFVATVDHGLRAEARQEAEQVGLWAKALGLPHRILRWEGTKPKTRVQERAREARYDLLCTYASEAGADRLVTAHHADDQAETILFRLLRGSGLKGLGGMAAATERGGLRHVRPLLDWTKADLIALCQDRNQPFIEDPSNKNPAFARTRMRQLSSLLAEHGLDRNALLRLGARAARADAALQAHAIALAESLENCAVARGFEADISALAQESEEILGRILDIKIRLVTGKEVSPRLDRLEAAAAHLHAALVQGTRFSATLGGTALNLDRKSYLSIWPEAPRQRGRIKPTELS